MGRFIFSIIIFLILTAIMITLYMHDLAKQHAGVGLFWIASLVWLLLSIPQKNK